MAKRKLLTVSAGLAVFAGVGAWALLRGPSDLQYRTAVVDRGNVAYTVSATGTPNAVTVDVGSQVSGNIMALHADFHTNVTKEQVVARIDPQIFQARVEKSLDTALTSAPHECVRHVEAIVVRRRTGRSQPGTATARSKPEPDE